jgi:hypothetical protein
MALANGASPATSAVTEGGAQKIIGYGNPESCKSSKTQNQASPIEAFTLRAECRALLWADGELSLHEAVDVLQANAERDGLVELIGQDAVQAIMAAAFQPFREAPQ